MHMSAALGDVAVAKAAEVDKAMTKVNGNCDRLRDANPASVTEPAVGRGARNRHTILHTPLDLTVAQSCCQGFGPLAW